jgi:hypothetical protein
MQRIEVVLYSAKHSTYFAHFVHTKGDAHKVTLMRLQTSCIDRSMGN